MNNVLLALDEEKIPTDEEIKKLEKSAQEGWSYLKFLLTEDGAQQLFHDRSLASASEGKPEATSDTLEEYLRKVKPRGTRLELRLQSQNPSVESKRTDLIIKLKATLGDRLELLEIQKERRRVHDVVTALEEEIQLDRKADICPICLDRIQCGLFDKEKVYVYPCCGKRTCHKPECPLCRHPLIVSDEEAKANMEKFAKEGRPYQQYLMGRQYLAGRRPGGQNESNDQKGLEYFIMAANNGDPEAAGMLGYLYKMNPQNIVNGESYDESFRWFKLAAENGHAKSYGDLAHMYNEGLGCEKNVPEAVRLMTFAAHHGDISAQGALAQWHAEGLVLEGGIPQFERAKYWYGKQIAHSEEELREDDNLGAYADYASILMFLTYQNLEGAINIDGLSTAPEAMFWYRKSKDLNALLPAHQGGMQGLEQFGKYRCAMCYAQDSGTIKLRPCSRCKWAHYCGKECQVKHWRYGHKDECRKDYSDKKSVVERIVSSTLGSSKVKNK